jgi:hypothetical protein
MFTLLRLARALNYAPVPATTNQRSGCCQMEYVSVVGITFFAVKIQRNSCELYRKDGGFDNLATLVWQIMKLQRKV